MRIVSRKEWGARHGDGSGPAPLPARGLYLHHSAGAARNSTAAIRQLEDIGQQRFGAGISYTFAVTPDGTVYEGHSIGRRGTHTGGLNSKVRAVVLVGDYSRTPPSADQERAVADLLRHGVDQGWWPRPVLLGGHRDVATTGTACPGQAAYDRIAAINALATTEEDVTPEQAKQLADIHSTLGPLAQRVRNIEGAVARLDAALPELLEGVSAQEIAEAIPDGIAAEVVEALGDRLKGQS